MRIHKYTEIQCCNAVYEFRFHLLEWINVRPFYAANERKTLAAIVNRCYHNKNEILNVQTNQIFISLTYFMGIVNYRAT